MARAQAAALRGSIGAGERFPSVRSLLARRRGALRRCRRVSGPGKHAGAGTNSWAAIPLGAPVLGGIDEVLNQTLVYEATIDADAEFCGPLTAHLRFSCNEIDSQIVARVGRVDAGGGYHLLSMGTISAAPRRLDPGRSTRCEIAIDTESPRPLTPGEPVPIVFSLTPAPVRLRRGEKLRLDIASRTDLLKSNVSHGYAQFDLPAPPYFSPNTIRYAPDSYLELNRVQS